jgi:hypothetical protein
MLGKRTRCFQYCSEPLMWGWRLRIFLFLPSGEKATQLFRRVKVECIPRLRPLTLIAYVIVAWNIHIRLSPSDDTRSIKPNDEICPHSPSAAMANSKAESISFLTSFASSRKSGYTNHDLCPIIMQHSVWWLTWVDTIRIAPRLEILSARALRSPLIIFIPSRGIESKSDFVATIILSESSIIGAIPLMSSRILWVSTSERGVGMPCSGYQMQLTYWRQNRTHLSQGWH